MSQQPDNDDPTRSYPSKGSPLPKSFGRYRVLSKLGRGGFGDVYRAIDEQLQREVAVKVTRGESLEPDMRQSFLIEARTVAKLDHPHIVPVLDVGPTDQGDFYVVSKLIEGMNLADRIESDRPNRTLSLRIVEQIADALHYAHSQGLVHRDVKPANILLDRSDRPYLTDFGIALRETEQRRKGDDAGTPAYMSPEQARGLGHRLDYRSDIYSLGVVLYELLTGRRPFRSDNKVELMKLIATEEVRSPRLFDDSITSDLERICMKALARRASDRFTVARDFAEEIRWLLAQQPAPPAVRPSTIEPPAKNTPVANTPATNTPANPTPASNATPRNVDATARDSDSNRTGPTKIVPKGLRSFDASDAGFFLDLLPGPFDREGIPEALRFWKTRIEETDSERTFKVGLIYGPSGCGKSSLMKAGLLPRLSSQVISVYVEATPDDTEMRLLRAVRKAIPDAEGGSLRDVLSNIRRRRLVPSGGKLLLVLDQFEQWLFAESDYAKASMTDALLQCDGSTVQSIVMVREDFWISVSRFLAELDIPIVERENSAMVDLFSVEHAAKVLGLFGKAYGNLPDSSKDWTEDHREFIRQSVEGLSQDKKVISVQIAVLADMMKLRNWSTATLQEVGGVEGVGVTFLEEMFGSRHAPMQHRQHQEAVRGLLATLLPAIGTDIKGSMQSAASLRKAAGYEHKPREFQSLIEILDKNLRLITPVDDGSLRSEGRSEKSENTSNFSLPSSAFYQLAHDYLVPSLREWLTRKQRETKKGRAELKLAERAAVWSANPEYKQLPTLVEWFQIRYWTDRKRWKTSERSLMRTAARVHARNWGSSILLVALMTGVIGYLFQQQHERSLQGQIAVMLDSLQTAPSATVLLNIEKLLDMKRSDLICPDLERRYANAKESQEKLSLALGLASFGQVEVDYLISQLYDIEYRDTANLIAALGNDRLRSIEKLKQAASECRSEERWKRKATLALAALALGDTNLPIDACEFEGRADPGVRTWFIHEFPSWGLNLGDVIHAVANTDSPALRSGICLAIGSIPASKVSADNKERITQVASEWFSLPDSSTHSAVVWLMQEWEIPDPTLTDAKQVVNDRNWFVNSQGVTFVKINPKSIDPKQLPDPLETYRERLRNIKAMPLEEKNSPSNRYASGEALYQTGQYEAALSEFDTLLKAELGVSVQKRKEILQLRLLSLARLNRLEETDLLMSEWKAENPDSRYVDYVESVVLLWLGRKEAAVQRLEKSWAQFESSMSRQRRYNIARATALFASSDVMTVEENRFFVGRSLNLLELWSRGNDEDRQRMRGELDLSILHAEPTFVKLTAELSKVPERPYWLANREVTRGEYEAFLNDTSDAAQKPSDPWKPDPSISPTPDHPAQFVNWNDALMYCNWLSRREGRRLGYRLVSSGKWQLDETADGYRLPREVEWEYACRAGSETDWSTGSEESLLEEYCQMQSFRASPSGKKLPNAWGFHDMHGNVWEWCWDRDGELSSNPVFRGGCWGLGAAYCRSASGSSGGTASYRNFGNGFRLALSPSGIPK